MFYFVLWAFVKDSSANVPRLFERWFLLQKFLNVDILVDFYISYIIIGK